MSQTRKSIASIVLLTVLGSAGVGGFKASQVEPATPRIDTVAVDVDGFTAEDFAALDKTPRRLHQWMQTEGEKQVRNHR